MGSPWGDATGVTVGSTHFPFYLAVNTTIRRQPAYDMDYLHSVKVQLPPLLPQALYDVYLDAPLQHRQLPKLRVELVEAVPGTMWPGTLLLLSLGLAMFSYTLWLLSLRPPLPPLRPRTVTSWRDEPNPYFDPGRRPPPHVWFKLTSWWRGLLIYTEGWWADEQEEAGVVRLEQLLDQPPRARLGAAATGKTQQKEEGEEEEEGEECYERFLALDVLRGLAILIWVGGWVGEEGRKRLPDDCLLVLSVWLWCRGW